MSAKACANCLRPAGDKQAHCTFCGAPLANRCQSNGRLFGDPCRKSCDVGAAYCPACGCEPLFKRNGILAGRFDRAYQEPGEMDEMSVFDHRFFTRP